ncbi:unnamed protein product [Effrenium voratum]|uniref:Uncharacterized protein n=1 Tax=Effrenium voratum TaxID=2562239 RepID=A0AA36JDY8_9DINO|nr:unnamed protein product [Effrenium voratum]
MVVGKEFSASLATSTARGLHWTLAISMLRTLQLHQLTPGSGSLASAGSACDRGLQWAQTLALLRGARGKGVQPSLMLYGTTVSVPSSASQNTRF